MQNFEQALSNQVNYPEVGYVLTGSYSFHSFNIILSNFHCVTLD